MDWGTYFYIYGGSVQWGSSSVYGARINKIGLCSRVGGWWGSAPEFIFKPFLSLFGFSINAITVMLLFMLLFCSGITIIIVVICITIIIFICYYYNY